MAAPALFAAATGGVLCPFPGRIAAGGTPKRHLSYCFTRGAGEIHSIWFCGTGEVHVRLFPRVFVALVCFVWLFLWAPCGRNGSRDRWQVGHKAVEQGGALYIYGAFWRLQASACQWGFEVGFLWEYGQLGLRGVPLQNAETACVLVSVWELSSAACLGTLPAVLPDPDAGDGLSSVP